MPLQKSKCVRVADMEKFSSTCAPDPLRPVVAFPGDYCDMDQKFRVCRYGKKRCLGNRCLGYASGEGCIGNEDCSPLFFCDSGLCRFEKKQEDLCKYHYECTRKSMCYKGGPGSYSQLEFGVCKAFFSLENGQSKMFSGAIVYF
jgi:hypothetical protein